METSQKTQKMQKAQKAQNNDNKNQKNVFDPNHALYDNIHLLDDLLYRSLEAQLKPEIIKIDYM